MPSSLTSSFASAAASGMSDNTANRRDASNTNEWSRSRPNGATQTFRRPSQPTTQSRDTMQTNANSSSTGAYIPPHMNNSAATLRNGAMGDSRYSKDQLLEIYQFQKEAGLLNRNLQELFLGQWSTSSGDGLLPTKTDGKDQTIGPEVCWNYHNDNDPLGLLEFSDVEKQLFTTSVNSPLKLNSSKEGSTAAPSNRKPSVSNHHGPTYSSTSGPATRPGTRRRETGESFGGTGPLSPADNKHTSRNDASTSTPPPALLRRRTDFKEDDSRGEPKEEEAGIEGPNPFGSLRRLATGPLSAGLNGPTASPWSAGGSRSAFESMGSFGSFNTTASPAVPDSEKRPVFGSMRANSRFKDLLQKQSAEDMSPSIKEKGSNGALEKLLEEDSGVQSRMKDVFKTRPNRSETNPFEDTIPRSGSAALSNDDHNLEQLGFSAFNQGDPGVHGTPGVRRGNDPLSPTSTNPYQSPGVHRTEEDEPGEQGGQQHGLGPFGTSRRDMFAGNQTSGFGGARPGLGGLGALPSWGSSSFGGTPGRDRGPISTGFGDTIFSPMGDLQSPGGNIFGSAGFGNTGRTSSRLGALFPPAMQEQMRSDSRNDASETPLDNLGSRDPFDGRARRQESGFRGMFGSQAGRPGEALFNAQAGVPGPAPSHAASASQDQPSGHGPSPSGGSVSSTALPATQQRQMVMPDRMRWIYRDPQGNVQGPWSGLEMHDWFKAGFFTAELQVKKLEDGEYEPLAQLVRRIGNSREPFLVPQIGVPHGPPSSNQGNQWANNLGSGGTQPPFAGSFPSFGTTLTAEQQNALERRKQEEQYLMARQKEHLAQQQLYMKQMQMQGSSGTGHGLQHHSSAHSLHSQPSLGSITSPGGYQPSPMQAPIQPPQTMPAFGHNSSTTQHHARDEDLPGMMERMNFSQRGNIGFGTSPIGQQPASFGASHETFAERVGQGSEQASETRVHDEAFLGRDGRNERLEEFRDLRNQLDDEVGSLPLPIGAQRPAEEDAAMKQPPMPIGSASSKSSKANDEESLSLTQQVQRTAAANEKAAAYDKILDLPPMSISPLPAPTPNRNRQHVADQLAAESRSQSQTPVEPTSVAPWAQAELPKGPSLKEIQEAEAKRAAEQEANMVAARRAQAEQERAAAAANAIVIPPAPGLPATSNWAASASPASPGPAANVWGAKQAAKPVTGGSTSKKTLAQIQKEEELKKQKAAAQSVAQAKVATTYNVAGPGGKRYAELASKTIPTSTSPVSGSWHTVGSDGKPKTPAAVVAAPQITRTVSSSNMAAASRPRPTLQTRTTSTSNKSKADEEFLKWARTGLVNELNAGLAVDAFINNLLAIPADKEILRDVLYTHSQTINGDRFAEEWIRRRKLADKGIIEPATDLNSPVGTDGKNAGWNEVAKKNPSKEDTSSNQAFKVVAKKKGRR